MTQQAIPEGAALPTTPGVYEYHFDAPFGHAGHYLGASRNVAWRDGLHRSGQGANLLRRCNDAGIGYRIVRVWPTDTAKDAYLLESRLKKGGSRARYCPVCKHAKEGK